MARKNRFTILLTNRERETIEILARIEKLPASTLARKTLLTQAEARGIVTLPSKDNRDGCWAREGVGMMDIGKAIRAVRKLKGLTLEQLAELIGSSVSHLSEIERGEAGLQVSELDAICEAMGVPVSDMITMASLTEVDKRKLDRLFVTREAEDDPMS